MLAYDLCLNQLSLPLLERLTLRLHWEYCCGLDSEHDPYDAKLYISFLDLILLMFPL